MVCTAMGVHGGNGGGGVLARAAAAVEKMNAAAMTSAAVYSQHDLVIAVCFAAGCVATL
jgi:hypothetical protein